uniref:Uncharacterized protein n=1 Tax=Anguilla anguilla TaxID=7936 RepID=A0A0E9TQ85_ANGAN
MPCRGVDLNYVTSIMSAKLQRSIGPVLNGLFLEWNGHTEDNTNSRH